MNFQNTSIYESSHGGVYGCYETGLIQTAVDHQLDCHGVVGVNAAEPPQTQHIHELEPEAEAPLALGKYEKHYDWTVKTMKGVLDCQEWNANTHAPETTRGTQTTLETSTRGVSATVQT
jgi:hypothetical protein